MALITPLRDAVSSLVRDGGTVALEGFIHLIPHAAGHDIIRQAKRDLTLTTDSPDAQALAALRDLQARTATAHGQSASGEH